MHAPVLLLCTRHAPRTRAACAPSAHRVHTACAGAKEVEIRSRLGRFGIENQHAWQPMSKLSGGQKSRVVLCAISWAEPTFLILDECALAPRPSPLAPRPPSLAPCPSPLEPSPLPRPSNPLRRCWAPAG